MAGQGQASTKRAHARAVVCAFLAVHAFAEPALAQTAPPDAGLNTSLATMEYPNLSTSMPAEIDFVYQKPSLDTPTLKAVHEGPIQAGVETNILVGVLKKGTVGDIDLWRMGGHNYSKFFSLRAIKNTSPCGADEKPTFISIYDALTLAFKNNLDMLISRAQAQQQTAAAASALAKFLPSVDLAVLRENNRTTKVNGYRSVASAAITYPVSRGGAVAFSAAAQIEFARAAWLARTAQTNTTLFQVSQAYAGLLREQAVLRIRMAALSISTFWSELYNLQYNTYAGRLNETNNSIEGHKRFLRDRQGEESVFEITAPYLDKLLKRKLMPPQRPENMSKESQRLQAIRLRRDQFEAQMYDDLQALIAQVLAVKRASINLAVLLSFQLPKGARYPNGLNLLCYDTDVSEWDWIRLEPVLPRDWLRLLEAIKTESCSPMARPHAGPGQFVRPEIPTVSPKSIEQKKYNLAALNSLAILNRPELKQADLTRTGNKLLAETNLASLAPRVNLVQSWNKIGTNLSGAPQTYNPSYSVATSFANMGLSSLSDFIQQGFVVRQNTFQYNQVLIGIVNEVTNAFLTMVSAETQKVAAEKAACEAAAYLESISDLGPQLDQWQEPRVIDVLNAERQYTTSMIQQIDAVTQYNVAQAALLRAVGTNALAEKKLKLGILCKDAPPAKR